MREATVDLPLPGFVTSATNFVVVASCPLSTAYPDGSEGEDDRAVLLLLDPRRTPHYIVTTVDLTDGLPTAGPTTFHHNINDAVREYVDGGGGN